jgi:caffeoyl-CoA O-methyltransferase
LEMTPERWRFTQEYSREVFGREDAGLTALMAEAVEAGLPDIAISADVGRLIKMITSCTKGRLALEIGTLGGYSAIWIVRGLAPDGKLITIEPDDKHIAFAERQFERNGVADRITIRRGKALEVLPELSGEIAAGSVDVVFLDAEKTEYPDYWRMVRPLIAVGGFIIADNVYGSGSWWIDSVGDATRRAADRFNRTVADDADFEAVALPIRQGVLIGRRMR